MICPKCGKRSFSPQDAKRWDCVACGFTYFHNTAAAVVALIEQAGSLLVTIRAVEPGAGMLDLPGGFVDPGETLEEAVIREVKEELNLEMTTPQYLCSFPNTYPYGGISYATIDAFFLCHLRCQAKVHRNGEIAGWSWRPIRTLRPEAFGFASIQKGVASFLACRSLQIS